MPEMTFLTTSAPELAFGVPLRRSARCAGVAGDLHDAGVHLSHGGGRHLAGLLCLPLRAFARRLDLRRKPFRSRANDIHHMLEFQRRIKHSLLLGLFCLCFFPLGDLGKLVGMLGLLLRLLSRLSSHEETFLDFYHGVRQRTGQRIDFIACGDQVHS